MKFLLDYLLHNEFYWQLYIKSGQWLYTDLIRVGGWWTGVFFFFFKSCISGWSFEPCTFLIVGNKNESIIIHDWIVCLSRMLRTNYELVQGDHREQKRWNPVITKAMASLPTNCCNRILFQQLHSTRKMVTTRVIDYATYSSTFLLS